MKNKFYVVFVDRKPRVHTTWMDCHRQVSRYPNNLHNSFPSRKLAKQALFEFQEAQSKRNISEVETFVELDVIVDKKNHQGVQINVKDTILGVLIAVVIIQAYYLWR